MDELVNFEELQKVLADYARDAVEIYRYQLSLGGKNASRTLADTATARVEVRGQTYEVVMNLQEYWKFVERGRKGKVTTPAGEKVNVPSYTPNKLKTELGLSPVSAGFPPMSAILNWISVKPIIPRPRNGKIPTPETLAFLIGRKIEQEGIEPHPAMATTLEELDRLYYDKIVSALGHDIYAYIAKIAPLG
jgi:hypothetical protein